MKGREYVKFAAKYSTKFINFINNLSGKLEFLGKNVYKGVLFLYILGV
jgi:hypothetical protein